MSEGVALAVLLGLTFCVGLTAVISGLVYWRSNGQHGGVVCFILSIIALTMGGDIYHRALGHLK